MENTRYYQFPFTEQTGLQREKAIKFTLILKIVPGNLHSWSPYN